MLTDKTLYDTGKGSCFNIFDHDIVQFGKCLPMFRRSIKLSTLKTETEFSHETFLPN